MEDFARVYTFILEVDRLKGVLRKTRPLAIDRAENSAEHSWHVALLALLLEPYASEPVNVAHAVEILLVHDIPEIEVGDVFVYATPDPNRAADEAAGARKVFGLLPPVQADRCFGLWQEYEQRRTPESRFAYAMDRLMPLMHNLQQGGGTWRELGIDLDRVLALNDVTGEIVPEVWRDVRARIIDCFAAMCDGAASSG